MVPHLCMAAMNLRGGNTFPLHGAEMFMKMAIPPFFDESQ
jgi:hypothetical protein